MPLRATVQTPKWPPLPPTDESEEGRVSRQKKEEEAKRVTYLIDQSISAEREQKKRTRQAKILLLGMSPHFAD